MLPFKNGLRVYSNTYIYIYIHTPSNVFNITSRIDSRSRNGPQNRSKSLPKRTQRALGGVLNDDSVAKLKIIAAS